MYEHLTYLKVLRVLEQLREELKARAMESDQIRFEQGNYYQIEIETFEEKSLQCFNAMEDLYEAISFKEPDSFSLIYATFCLTTDSPAFSFCMGQHACKLGEFFVPDDPKEDLYDEILPINKNEDTSWETVLSSFIKKVRTLSKKQA